MNLTKKSYGYVREGITALLFAAALMLVGCISAKANTIATATELAVDGTKTGKIYITSEPTYYKFTVPTSGS